MSVLTPVREYLDSLVHPSAQRDGLTAARHRAFIAPRLVGSLVALAAFPVYIATRGAPGPIEISIFAWLVTPILIAYFLSRTGRYESAHVLSSLALTGLVAAVAFETGGIGSFAAIWLVLVPLEAALSASRRVVALASTFALVAAGVLVALGAADLLPSPQFAGGNGTLTTLGIIAAALYATGLALGAELLARTSQGLLYAEEDRYRLLARNMTDVITRHGRHGAVSFISPAAEAMFGAPLNQLTGHGLFDRVHVADRPAYLTALSGAATLDEGCTAEFRVRRQADRAAAVEFIWVEMRCRPLDPASGPGDVVAVMRDISDRKTQEQALELARVGADKANVAKSRFLATMSHELRTPLNAIIGFSEMLTQEDEMRLDAARRSDYARIINESGQHLLAVVNGILDMSKIETGEFTITPEPFAPAQALSQCCDLLALKAREAGLDLVTRLPDDLPEMIADKRALKQIVLNLLSNAVKFTDRGGKITVSANTDGAVMTVIVEDTGAGISAEDLPRLGQPFFQARATYDRRHEGTGLGLSIVRGLTMLHGGHVEIESRLGKGTCVIVKLPLDCERAGIVAKEHKTAQPAAFAIIQNAAEIQVRKSA